MPSVSLPPFAPFPTAAWKELLSIDEWNASLSAWISLAEAHLSLSDLEFTTQTINNESVVSFLTSFMRQVAVHGSVLLGSTHPVKILLKDCFLLVSRILKSPSPSPSLLQWEFLSDFNRVYSKKRVSSLLSQLPQSSQDTIEASLSTLKKFLVKNLDDGLKGDLKAVEERLQRLNHVISSSPSTASFFLAGSEFLDGLIGCYKIMNPPLRKVIITTTCLSLVGLIESEPPKFSVLTDQLYSLKTAAEAHKAGPLNANDSLVAELVSTTPLLQQIEHKMEALGTENVRTKNFLRDLAAFKKPGAGMKPKRLIRRKVDKGKGVALDDHDTMAGEIHIHRMSQITQIQDLFPELGSGFVSKLLDQYDNDTEQVVAHLLEDSLPASLQSADRTEQLYVFMYFVGASLIFVFEANRIFRSSTPRPRRKSSLVPRPTPPQIPTRRNVFDDDELDRLVLDTSKLHFGKREPSKTADDMLADRSAAPNKAAILSALATFDLDDDERDDTYDSADVGGTVDNTNADDPKDDNEEALWKAYQADPKNFDRDQATRRGGTRTKLKEETGMTDEAIEGWAIMLSRNANQKRRLELKYSAASAFSGKQNELASTSWRASPAGSGTEVSDTDGGGSGGRGRGGARGRGRGYGGRGGARGGGNVAGPSGEHDTEQARRRKEASKSQRANHSRRDQRAKKMARGGFPG